MLALLTSHTFSLSTSTTTSSPLVEDLEALRAPRNKIY
jgi:hypothetical protein